MIEAINKWATELSTSEISAKQLNQTFEWDTTSNFVSNYSTSPLKIERINFEGPSYQLVSKYPLSKTTPTSILFTIESYGKENSDICVGILAESRKSEKWSGDFEGSVGYWTSVYEKKNGNINIEGKAVLKIEELFVEERGSVQMNVDLDKMTVRFVNHSQPNRPNWEFPLPSSYRNGEIHYFVVTNRVGAKISLFS